PDVRPSGARDDRVPAVRVSCAARAAFELALAVNLYIPPQPVDGAASDDREEPVPQAAAPGIKAGGVSPDGKKGVLDGILCRAPVVENAERQAVGESAIAIVERFDRGGVAALQLGRHVMVLVFRLPAHPRT